MRVIAVLCALFLVTGATATFARAKPHPRRPAVPPPIPSADAVELGTLAPPTRLSTLRQTYGDAAIARDMARRGYPAAARHDRAVAATTGAPYPCDPNTARATVIVCGDQRGHGYGQGYAFTPSYVSAPQVFEADPFAQDQIFPPATAFFWSLNRLTAYPRD